MGAEKRDTTTYLIQIVNKPHQIATLKARYASIILFVIQHIAKPIVELGRRTAEAMELMQGRGTRYGPEGYCAPVIALQDFRTVGPVCRGLRGLTEYNETIRLSNI